MNRFIVSGVPRSGTTALANLLNWHPNVFCGIERFPLATVDQSFFTRESVNDESIPSAHTSRNKEILGAKPHLEALGDKGPRYFYKLASPDSKFPDTKLVFIIRDITDVFLSWNKRAHNENDTSWHRGQTGVFAYIDYLQLLYTLNRIHQSHESLIISYEALFFGQPERQHEIIDRLLDFIGATPSERVQKNFDDESAKRQSLRKRKVELASEEMEFLKSLELEPLFQALAEQNGITTPKRINPVTRALLKAFYLRRHGVLSAIDTLMPPGTGISQAITVMRLCYELSGGENIFSDIKYGENSGDSNIELLAMLLNASQAGDYEEAFAIGWILLGRFPECPELLVEMSSISTRLKNNKAAISFTKQAMKLRPNNSGLVQRLAFLKDRL